MSLLFSHIVGTSRLDAESRPRYLLLSRPGGYYDDHAVSVAPVHFSELSSSWNVDNRMSSLGCQLKSQCRVHRWRIDEQNKVDGIEIVIRENLCIAGVSECSVRRNNIIRGGFRGFRVESLWHRAQVHPFVHTEINFPHFHSDRPQSRPYAAGSHSGASPKPLSLLFFFLCSFHEP
jgi:hypothetical protein